MKKLNYLLVVTLLSGLFVFSSCDKEDDDPMQPEPKSIAEIASENADLSTLVEALIKADLAGTLSGAGDFTVFAPDNDAFDALFTALGVSGIQDLSADDLKPILLYHVLGEKKTSSMISAGYYSSLSPAQGLTVSMYIGTDMGVSINDAAKVTSADIEASNGVIHVIDAVLTPTSVVDIALNNGSFTQLVEAVVKAGLVETLSGEGPFTIFAPTDAAFEELYTALGVSGIEEISAETLIPILQYHVVSGNVRSDDLSEGDVATLNGSFSLSLAGPVTINGTSEVIATDVQGTNGVVHVIDEVLMP